MLRRLLSEIARQQTGGLFALSVVIADNDESRSAESVVDIARAELGLEIKYCIEPRQNIAMARNMVVENAWGDYLAFIDDDEFPGPDWLLTLFNACNKYKVDGVLGPVKPYFEDNAPKWVVDGHFYDRPSYPTGYVIDGSKGRTGNVLLRRSIFAGGDPPFRPEFLTGEDQDFFRRMIDKGHSFIWCHEAMAWEAVPPVRWSRKFIIKRALLRGAISLRHPTCGAACIFKSFLAVPCYALMLPLQLLRGQGSFMKYIDRFFHHLGRILALFRIDCVGNAYVTQ
jgi:cellulose synthase/poly-beta-1,6-N-acetylglucosamine synthase-like glycosyltransferase